MTASGDAVRRHRSRDGGAATSSGSERSSSAPSSVAGSDVLSLCTPHEPLERYLLYETRLHYYLVGHTRSRREWRLLKIPREPDPFDDGSEASDPGGSLGLVQDPCVYSEKEMGQLLWRLQTGNEHHGGIKLVKKAYGLVGFVQFLKNHYLILITKRKRCGTLFGHRVYGVCGTTCVPILPSHAGTGPGFAHLPKRDIMAGFGTEADEKRYLRLFLGVDLCKEFFFSYTYPLWHTLQHNVTLGIPVHLAAPSPSAPSLAHVHCPFTSKNMFVWNVFLATEYTGGGVDVSRWFMPLIHGFFGQVTLSSFGKNVTLTLIARRSRYFAGTRFLKRGVNDLGQVANEVETEQVVDAGKPVHVGRRNLASLQRHNALSSVVQVRGSIPLYWTQEANPLNPKPEIVLERYDPSYQATQRHFDHLCSRYGYQVIVLNLIKSIERRPREMILRVEFAQAVDYLNKHHYVSDLHKLLFVHWDFSKCTKQRGVNVLAAIEPVVKSALQSTGIFVASPHHDVLRQSGALRTNCIDCLDRTNVAQFAYGLYALELQLHGLGVIDNKRIDPRSEVATQLMNLYENMGDSLALQYGGSEAHSVFFQRQKGNWEATTQSKDLMTSFRRFYNNTYTDAAKQDAINLFLGNYVPRRSTYGTSSKIHLWDLDSDYYMHSKGNSAATEDLAVYEPVLCSEDGMRASLNALW